MDSSSTGSTWVVSIDCKALAELMISMQVLLSGLFERLLNRAPLRDANWFGVWWGGAGPQ